MPARLIELIDRIYEAAIDRCAWSAVMREIASTLNSATAHIQMHDFSDDSFDYLALHPDHPLESITEYNASWRHRDPFRVKAERMAGTLGNELDLAPPGGPARAEIYKDFYVKWGWGRGIGGYIVRTAEEGALFGVARSIDDEPYTAEEIGRARILGLHLGRGVEVHRSLKAATALKELSECALDTVGAGVVVLDERGHVAVINEPAQRLLRARDGLVVEQRSLDTHDPVSRAALQEAIRKALTAGPDRGGAACVVQRRSGDPLQLLVSPAGQRHSKNAGALVVITTRETDVDQLAAQLAARHPLTPAEAAAAAALCRGLSPAEIAQTTGKSVNTVRTHLKNIQAKLGVHGQAQIVAELLRGPGFIRR